MTTSPNPAKAGPYDIAEALSTQYPFSFSVESEADVRVVAASLGIEPSSGKEYVESEADLVLNLDYSVTVNGDQQASPGGHVQLLRAVAGERLAVLRSSTVEQALELQSQGPWNPEALELALDKVVRYVQMALVRASGSLARPVCEASGDYGYDLSLVNFAVAYPSDESVESAKFASLGKTYIRYIDDTYEYHCYADPAEGLTKTAAVWKVVRQALDRSSLVPAGTGLYAHSAKDLATVQALTYTLGA